MPAPTLEFGSVIDTAYQVTQGLGGALNTARDYVRSATETILSKYPSAIRIDTRARQQRAKLLEARREYSSVRSPENQARVEVAFEAFVKVLKANLSPEQFNELDAQFAAASADPSNPANVEAVTLLGVEAFEAAQKEKAESRLRESEKEKAEKEIKAKKERLASIAAKKMKKAKDVKWSNIRLKRESLMEALENLNKEPSNTAFRNELDLELDTLKQMVIVGLTKEQRAELKVRIISAGLSLASDRDIEKVSSMMVEAVEAAEKEKREKVKKELAEEKAKKEKAKAKSPWSTGAVAAASVVGAGLAVGAGIAGVWGLGRLLKGEVTNAFKSTGKIVNQLTLATVRPFVTFAKTIRDRAKAGYAWSGEVKADEGYGKKAGRIATGFVGAAGGVAEGAFKGFFGDFIGLQYKGIETAQREDDEIVIQGGILGAAGSALDGVKKAMIDVPIESAKFWPFTKILGQPLSEIEEAAAPEAAAAPAGAPAAPESPKKKITPWQSLWEAIRKVKSTDIIGAGDTLSRIKLKEAYEEMRRIHPKNSAASHAFFTILNLPTQDLIALVNSFQDVLNLDTGAMGFSSLAVAGLRNFLYGRPEERAKYKHKPSEANLGLGTKIREMSEEDLKLWVASYDPEALFEDYPIMDPDSKFYDDVTSDTERRMFRLNLEKFLGEDVHHYQAFILIFKEMDAKIQAVPVSPRQELLITSLSNLYAYLLDKKNFEAIFERKVDSMAA